MKKIVKEHEPFIGITCDVYREKKVKSNRHYALVCDYRYPEVIKRAGGYPILLPMAFRKRMIRRYLKQIDGIVIVGGDDVDPKFYGEKRKPGTGSMFAPRLHFEIQLYREARKRGLPILGICYGMQLINVIEGGSLFQDITRDAGSKFNHRNRKRPLHGIRIDRRSRLGKILGQQRITVHSSHHQAVCRVAPKFKAVAYAPDGIVEAIESESEKIFAVQWHPERRLDDPVTQRLFHAFIRVCQRNRR